MEPIDADSVKFYSVPRESATLLQEGLIRNRRFLGNLPLEAEELSKKVRFSGNSLPSIAINWRFAESISALKALEGVFINTFLKRRYGVEPQDIEINTDHAQLFILSLGLTTIDPEGDAISPFSVLKNPALAELSEKYFPTKKWGDCEQHHGELHSQNATNIYRSKDGRFYHLHGDLNAQRTLASLGLPPSRPEAITWEDAQAPFIEKVAQINSDELDRLENDVYKSSGTVCWSIDEYRNSEQGKAQRDIGLWETFPVHTHGQQKACWWPESAETSPQRPLAGLKVVDLTRIIAGPAVARGLAELGASVMRITGEHIPDNPYLHCDMNWGKWNGHLDFRRSEDREKLHALVWDADVVVQGYRPGVLDKYGFSVEELLSLCKDRDRGLIVVKENCYGWRGPWSCRSGWQQISDANCGVSLEFGRAMGLDEPVTPVFPNSDYCTGVAGVLGTLDALLRRGKDGGSYIVEIALNYYSQWLVDSVGVYPPAVWEDGKSYTLWEKVFLGTGIHRSQQYLVWARNGRRVLRHYNTMPFTIPIYLGMLHKNSPLLVRNPDYFEDRECPVIGKTIRTVKPILQFPKDGVQLRFNVGTRTNGVDQPVWPKDLTTEIVV